MASRGARYLAGENLEVVRAKFSTPEDAVCKTLATHYLLIRSILELKTQPKTSVRLSPVRYHSSTGSVISSGREPISCLGRAFNFKLGSFT
jgi:hypothetical protein